MSELLHDAWARRDLPFLIEVARRFQDNPREMVWAQDVAAHLELDRNATLAAVDDLLAGEHLVRSNIAEVDGFDGITEKGLRAVGLWPSPEVAADRLMAALESIIEHTTDPEQRTRVEKIRDGFAQAGAQVAVSVASAMITGQLPH